MAIQPNPLLRIASAYAEGTAPEDDVTFDVFPLITDPCLLPRTDAIIQAAKDKFPYGRTLDKQLAAYMWLSMYAQRQCAVAINYKDRLHYVELCPGEYIDMTQIRDKKIHGPVADVDGNPMARVMLIGDYARGNSLDEAMDKLTQIMYERSIFEFPQLYYTTLVKFDPAFKKSGALLAPWKKMCLPWLHAEMKIIRPEYILCLGGESAKVILDNKAGPENSYGELYSKTIEFPDGDSFDTNVVVLAHPVNLIRPVIGSKADTTIPDQIDLWKRHIKGEDVTKRMSRVEIISTEKQLVNEVDRAISLGFDNPKQCIVAVDMEWEGSYPEEPGAFLRTLQFSNVPNEAVVVVINGWETRGIPVDIVAREMTRLLTTNGTWRPRLGGHFLRADLPQLIHMGIPEEVLMAAYAPADTPEQCKWEGGWDTANMYHAYSEEASFGLKRIGVSELKMHRWDRPIDNFLRDVWLKKTPSIYAKDGLVHIDESIPPVRTKKKDLRGYGGIPDDILHTYAAWDVAVTRSLAELMLFGDNGEYTRTPPMEDDGYGNSCYKPYWISQRAALAVLEIEQNGMLVDRTRLDELSELFTDVYDKLLTKFRQDINWPEFNPNSSRHKKGVLFGHRFAEKSMPAEARSFELEPIKATGKQGRPWEEIKGTSEEDLYSPATSKPVINILAYKHPEISLFKDVVTVAKRISGPLRPPKYRNDKGEVSTWCPTETLLLDRDTEEPDDYDEDNETSEVIYDDGFYIHMRNTGKIHTHISTTMRTGRFSSSRPNMQNLSKSADQVDKPILGYINKDGVPQGKYLDLLGGPRYMYPMRTLLRAEDGKVLIATDLVGAEVAALGFISQDPDMLEHIRRSNLPEDDPNFFDIHSSMAVKAFKLDCEPTKKGLASINKTQLRVAAKAVIFGGFRRSKSYSKRWNSKANFRAMTIPCWANHA